MKRLFGGILAVTISLAPFGLFAGTAHATTSGITIAPSQMDIALKQGETLTREIKVTNNTTYSQALTVAPIDFGGLDDSGGLIYLGQNETNRKYGLATWMTVDQSLVQLYAGQSTVVTVTIKDQTNLSPGAHYGGILFTKESAPATPQAQVPLRQSVASIIFLNKLGDNQTGLELTKVDYNNQILQNSRLALTFHNTGNIFEVPRGLVQIFDLRGREVYRGAINESSLKVFPGASRSYKVNLQKTVKALWPGRYKIVVNYRYDGQDQFTTQKAYFIYANPVLWFFLITIFLAIIAISVIGLTKLLKNPKNGR
jgi:hypothetical protein